MEETMRLNLILEAYLPLDPSFKFNISKLNNSENKLEESHIREMK